MIRKVQFWFSYFFAPLKRVPVAERVRIKK